MSCPADDVADLALNIRDFAALLQQIGFKQIGGKHKIDASLFENISRRVPENKMGVRRNVGEAAGIVRNQNSVGNDAHDVPMQRFALFERLRGHAMLGKMIEAVLELGYTGTQPSILIDQLQVGLS